MVKSSGILLGMAMTPLLIALASCIVPIMAPREGPHSVRESARAAPSKSPQSKQGGAPAILLESEAVSQGALLRGRVRPANGRLTLNGADVPLAPDGVFMIGFDRDAAAEAVLVFASASSAPRIERRFAVTAGNWRIQHINAPTRGAASSDADFERRRPGELAQMGAARRTVVTSDGWRQRFVWPVRGRISGVFGSQRVYRGVPSSYHNGVDVAVPTGTPYVAPADGVVILAASEPFTLEGYLLMIDHGMGLSSVFLHSSRLDVRTGDVVRQGQRLGAVGATGRATGPHLHWSMRWNGVKIDAQRVAGPVAQ